MSWDTSLSSFPLLSSGSFEGEGWGAAGIGTTQPAPSARPVRNADRSEECFRGRKEVYRSARSEREDESCLGPELSGFVERLSQMEYPSPLFDV
jgi:hypothetical protein